VSSDGADGGTPSGAPQEARRAYLIQGEDAGLLSQALTALISRLTADDDGLTPVEEYGEPGRGEPRRDEPAAIGPALEACRTLPFLATRRIVVLRDTSALDASQVKEVAAYLAEPLETTVLVLVHPGKSAPAALVKAVRAVGSVIDAVPAPLGRARSQWFAEHLKAAPVKLAPAAAARLEGHLGEDISRLEGILATVHAAFGERATVSADDLEPFLGSAGGVAPWDLTDAIDAGNAAAAVSALHRMVEAGERHPLQVLATLHRHFGAMLRLDGSGASDENAAAALTGMRPFPAKKALTQARRLGHDRIARAIALLAAADLDVRGRVGWPGEVVLEVLVARLARLARERPAPGRPGPARRGADASSR
jgi:DNA polymerase-3 subunit delta